MWIWWIWHTRRYGTFHENCSVWRQSFSHSISTHSGVNWHLECHHLMMRNKCHGCYTIPIIELAKSGVFKQWYAQNRLGVNINEALNELCWNFEATILKLFANLTETWNNLHWNFKQMPLNLQVRLRSYCYLDPSDMLYPEWNSRLPQEVKADSPGYVNRRRRLEFFRR
jgi:hypothetical protein